MQKVFPILLVVTLFVVGIGAFLGLSLQTLLTNEVATGTFGARLKQYANLDTGISVRYPENFSVNSAYVYNGLGREKQISGVAFSVPKERITGTNLSNDTKVTVEYIPSVERCSARMFIRDPKSVKPLLEDEDSYSFGVSTERVMGSVYEEQVYAIPNASPCVAVRYFIHYADIGKYPAGTVSAFNRADLLSAFDTVRHSLAVRTK